MRTFIFNDRHVPPSRPCRSLSGMQQVFSPGDRRRMRARLDRAATREFKLPDDGLGPLHIRDGNWERCR